MTESDPQFRVVLRGYEPGQVDRRLAELAERVESSEQKAASYAERVRMLEQQAAEGADREPETATPPTFAHLGERVTQILTLADEEAAAIRDAAEAEVEALRQQVETSTTGLRSEAEHYADERRR